MFRIPQTLRLKSVLGCDKERCLANTNPRPPEEWKLETKNPSYVGLMLECVVLVTHVLNEETRFGVEVLKWLLGGASV